MTDYQEIFRGLMPPAGDFPDCYAFSIHKAGSTLMHKMIGEVCSQVRLPAISIPDVLFKADPTGGLWDRDPDLLGLFQPGRIYYGYRHLPPAMLEPSFGLRGKCAVLLVRDPRDALVSEYFSYGGKHLSHVLPNDSEAKEKFLERIRTTSDMDIDAYVLRLSDNYRRKLEAYREGLDFGQVMLRRYEDIYFEKKKFLADIFAHFKLDVPALVTDAVAEKNDVRPQTEELGKHIRKGAPGDHREKLQPETIEKLNDKFRDICRDYGYEL